MNRFYKSLIILSLPLLIASCGERQEEKQETTTERVEIVSVSKLEKSKISRNIDLTSTLQGYKNINISPSLTGKIEHIFVEVGSHVKKGDMLVRMDQNQYRTTKLTFENIKTEYERIKILNETGTVSEQTYDQTKLNYEQTKESLDFLEKNTFVKAPITGVISAKNYEDGELFSGSPILALTQIHVLKAIINIPERYYPYVNEGMQVDIKSEIFPDTVFNATIEIVYPTIDVASHTFSAKLKIKNPDELLRPGMYVHTNLKLYNSNAIIAPYLAVLKLTGSNQRYVFINDNGKAKRVSVQLGDRFNDKIEIISDEIKEGDELVTDGQGKLVDGVKLSIK
jgi:RND family efflux transporter MFP subunit